jgi:hypothetical protein
MRPNKYPELPRSETAIMSPGFITRDSLTATFSSP